jgi:hypothetical protein
MVHFASSINNKILPFCLNFYLEAMKVISHNQLARELNIIVKAKSHNTHSLGDYCEIYVNQSKLKLEGEL